MDADGQGLFAVLTYRDNQQVGELAMAVTFDKANRLADLYNEMADGSGWSAAIHPVAIQLLERLPSPVEGHARHRVAS
jgi:hypothetical protein